MHNMPLFVVLFIKKIINSCNYLNQVEKRGKTQEYLRVKIRFPGEAYKTVYLELLPCNFVYVYQISRYLVVWILTYKGTDKYATNVSDMYRDDIS